MQAETGHPDEAIKSFTQSLSIRQRLASEYPSVTDFQNELAASHNNIGVMQKNSGQPKLAIESLSNAVAIRERLAHENPSVTEFQSELARQHQNISNLQDEMLGQPGEALASANKALAIRVKLARENPDVLEFQSDLAATHNNIGLLQQDLGHTTLALQSFEKALAIYDRLALEMTTDLECQNGLANTYYNIGRLQQLDIGQPDKAMASYSKALEIYERLALNLENVPGIADGLGDTLCNLALIDWGAGQLAKARDRLRKAIGWQKKSVAAEPGRSEFRQSLELSYGILRSVAKELEDPGLEAEATQALAELDATNPESIALDTRLAAIATGEPAKDNPERLILAQRAYDTKRHALAARLWSEALDADPALATNRQAQHRYNAACAAALAAASPPLPAGEGARRAGEGDPPVDEDAKVKLRAQALAWLQAELATWSKLLDSANKDQKTAIAQTLAHWQTDPDLASLRGDAIDALPEPERAPWRALWNQVEALRQKAADKVKPEAAPPANPAPELPANPFAK